MTRSVAVAKLYKALNALWENSLDPSEVAEVAMLPESVWKSKCPVGLDILKSAGITYANGRPAPVDTSKFDDLIKIHQKLEKWLIDNDEYGRVFYGIPEDYDSADGMSIYTCFTYFNHRSHKNQIMSQKRLILNNV